MTTPPKGYTDPSKYRTKTQSISVPYLAMVLRADPDHQRAKRNEVEYEFTGRTFRADPSKRGAYAED